ncbi:MULTISPECIES: hypothetical protein [unclassified Amycolatopsis]|uniref:DUF6918 family protein n=1 Tax=unclassified Amycolatopsis TaxID=2618356 RepID=UPI001FF6F1CC|nr:MULTISPECIES: hypothetical protein [unclassified Amycolatopsis]UOZ09028.1 hypothetical protein MUY22_12410 [Amycolatopsis sp. WQ 127309]WSJ75284.1 hypothetical protein OG439_38565 [Amycolatopsis sp. NBC_01307]WSK81059.1 hypothetical protein OG570_11075 [Amycolatopsis sp. NBC_01286]
MADTLKDILLDSSRRPAVVSDFEGLVDAEVSDKGGVSGAVVKTGFAAVKKIKPGIIPSAVDTLLPDFVGALEPFYGDFRAKGGSDFGAYLTSRSDEASDALLSVTDSRAERSSRDSIKKVYGKLRPNGKKNVEEALPRLGQLVDKHAAAV